MEYKITLKNEKLRFYNRMSWFIVILHILLFIYFALFSADKRIEGGAIIALILTAVLFTIKYVLDKRQSSTSIGFNFIFLVFAGFWIGMGLYWFAGVVLIFDLLASLATMKLVVSVSKDKITYPSISRNIIKWEELNNVLIKDGLLTIDFKTNKLIQELIDDSVTVTDPKEFNDFCKAILATHSSRLATN